MSAPAVVARGALLPRIEDGRRERRRLAPAPAGWTGAEMGDGAGEGPIDAVITWVDGADPAHRAKLRDHLAGLAEVPEIAGEERYRESGEFAFCIASLLRFAPWLRRIHVVTDAQEPGFMAALRASPWRDKVVIVDHTVLLAGHERHLPTFNIITLISMLWRVPGLADRFLFLNDDFALLRPVSPDDFFRGDSLVLRGKWCWHNQRIERMRQAAAGWITRIRRAPVARASNHHGQALAADMAGYRWRYFRVPHVPHPLIKPLLADYFDRHPAQLEENLKHRLRASEQFLADALVNHLAFGEGRAIVDNRLRTLRFKSTHYQAPTLERLIEMAERDESVAFACLQDLESLAPERRAVLFRWLERSIGRPEAIFGGAVVAAGG